jgi:hypothetical protein
MKQGEYRVVAEQLIHKVLCKVCNKTVICIVYGDMPTQETIDLLQKLPCHPCWLSHSPK